MRTRQQSNIAEHRVIVIDAKERITAKKMREEMKENLDKGLSDFWSAGRAHQGRER